jgi:hypothetical protein
MVKMLRRAQDVSEDDQLEVNPFAFVDEDLDTGQPGDFEFLRTTYSSRYANHVKQNAFYMGHRYIQVTDYTLLPGRRHKSFIRYLNVVGALVVNGGTFPAQLQVQSFEPQPKEGNKLLDIPKYIMSRIYDYAESVALDRDDQADIEIRTVGSLSNQDEIQAVQENIETFLYNNTWTFPSTDQTEELTLLCPMFAMLRDDATRGTTYMMKFLRFDPQSKTIYPYIYMVPLPASYNSLFIVQLSTGVGELTKSFELHIRLGARSNKFFTTYGFYNPRTLELKEINLPLANPDDCVVVSLNMTGILPQPDMTRLHNMFRLVEKEYNPITNMGKLVSSLSHGSDEFIMKTLGRRVNTFYNREDPDTPLKQIVNVRIYLAGQFNVNQRFRNSGVITSRGYTLYKNKDNDYFMQGYQLGYNRTQNASYLSKILNDFGCDNQNSFFSIATHGHQFLLSYNGIEYILHDPQVNSVYKLTDLNYPNYFDGNVINYNKAFIEFFATITNLPSQREIRVPELFTLYEYNRQTHSYSGDIYPIVRRAVNQFIVDRGVVPAQLPAISMEYIEFVRNPLTKMNLENFTSLDYDQISDFAEFCARNDLLLLTYPQPSISFRTVTDLEGALSRAMTKLTTAQSLLDIRTFTEDFIRRNMTRLRDSVQNYSFREVCDFIYSRPLFMSFVEEYIKDDSLVVSHIIDYLRSQQGGLFSLFYRKSILHTISIFTKVLDFANADGIAENLILYLIRVSRSGYLNNLVQIANFVIQKQAFVSGTEDGIARSIYLGLRSLAGRYENYNLSQTLEKAKDAAFSYIAKQAILNEPPPTVKEVNRFIQQQQQSRYREYLEEVRLDNEQRARMGLPEEDPDQRVISQILKKVVVISPNQITEEIERIKKKISEKKYERASKLQKITPYREQKEASFRYIDDYLDMRINQEYMRIRAAYQQVRFNAWPAGAMKDHALVVYKRLRKEFLDELDVRPALRIFTYIMNIIKERTPLKTRYLGARES